MWKALAITKKLALIQTFLLPFKLFVLTNAVSDISFKFVEQPLLRKRATIGFFLG